MQKMNWRENLLKFIPQTKQGIKAIKMQSKPQPIPKPPKWNHFIPEIHTKYLPRNEQPPTLKHGLDEIIKLNGPQFLIDPITNEYNYSKYLQYVPDIKNYDCSKLNTFKLPCQDNVII